MIISLSSIHGSPGVTSWSLLLAAAWPSGSMLERAMLEADPDGGVLALRYGLGVDPGVATLVAAVRRHDARNGLFDVSTVGRHLADRLWVIPSAESAERVVPVWAGAADEVAAMAASDERVWFVDCGRLSPHGFAGPFAARAELALVVTGPRQEDLVAVPARVAALQRTGAAAVGVLVVGKLMYGIDELREFAGTGLVWRVRAAADLVSLVNLALTSRRARRAWVWREAVDVAADIAGRFSPEQFGAPSSTVALRDVDGALMLEEVTGE